MKGLIRPRLERSVGRPQKLSLKVGDTSQNVAKSLFGIKSDKHASRIEQDYVLSKPHCNCQQVDEPTGLARTVPEKVLLP